MVSQARLLPLGLVALRAERLAFYCKSNRAAIWQQGKSQERQAKCSGFGDTAKFNLAKLIARDTE